MNEVEVEIMWSGKLMPVKLQKLTWGRKNAIEAQCIKISMVGGQLKPDLDLYKLKELMVLASIKEAPFVITMEAIQNLSIEDGEKLAEAVNNLHNMTEQKKTST